MTPLVSVVIPAFNRAETLARAVASVAAQTLTDIELIVVDDASTEDPTPIVQKNQGKVPAIVVRHGKNRGVSGARNSGVEVAVGRFVAFLDSDDEWKPSKLEAQAAAVLAQDDPEAWFCVCQTEVTGGGETLIKPAAGPVPDESFSDFLYLRNGFAQCSSYFLARKAAEAIRFDETLRQYEDHLFFLAAEAHGLGYLFVPEPLSVWHNDARAGRLSLADNLERGRKFIAAAGAKLTPSARLAFECKYLGPALVKSSPREALDKIREGMDAGVIGTRELASIALRLALPANAFRALRASLGGR